MSAETGAARYRGGGGTFLRTGGWAVLLGVEPGHSLVDLCWDQLAATSDLDDVLQTIVAQGLRAVPAFALVRETGERRVIARGALALLLDGTDVARDRHAGAWIDLPLADVATVEVSMTSDEPHGPDLPLRDGVAVAGGFHLVLPAAAADAQGPVPHAAAVDADTTDPREDPDHLFAETRTLAAVQAEAAAAARIPGGKAASADDTLPTTFTGGLAPTGEVRTAGREMFVSRQQLMRGADAIEVPRVLAAVCPAGHLTPAYSGLCRVCRQVVAPQEAFETARPALGRLTLPQGDSLLLDRGAVLGRSPYVPADWAGAQPHLVALHDPDHDVSAQHVSVVLDLWNVLVCDLGSTNGTALVDREGQVTKLRPHEPVALGPGSAVVLADVITLQFQVHP